jgi:WD40 repeat protein
MRPPLATRLSRTVVRCYPPRWQQRYRDEMLDVLDQHRASHRTVLSLAGGAVTAHLDPSYRMEKPVIRLRSDVVRKTLIALGTLAAVPALLAGLCGILVLAHAHDFTWNPGYADGDTALQLTPDQRLLAADVGGEPSSSVVVLWSVTPAGLRRLSAFEGGVTVAIAPDSQLVATSSFQGQAALWSVARPRHPVWLGDLTAGSSNALWGEAFSPDSKLLAAAYGGGVALWDVSRPHHARLLSVLNAHVGPVMHGDIAFSPDGHLLAVASGRGQATIWNVTRPAHGSPVATVTGRGGYFQALAFAPRGDLLAGVTTAGTVLVYSLADPRHPVLTAIQPDLATRALLPDGRGTSAALAASCPGCMVPSYALGFGTGGRVLTVVLERITPANSSRDTAFSWQVTASGGLTGGTSAVDNGWDGQPAVGPDGRTIVDGSAFGRMAVSQWELPPPTG